MQSPIGVLESLRYVGSTLLPVSRGSLCSLVKHGRILAYAYAEVSRNISWKHVFVGHTRYNSLSIIDGCYAILVVVHLGHLLAN